MFTVCFFGFLFRFYITALVGCIIASGLVCCGCMVSGGFGFRSFVYFVVGGLVLYGCYLCCWQFSVCLLLWCSFCWVDLFVGWLCLLCGVFAFAWVGMFLWCLRVILCYSLFMQVYF